MNFGGAADIAHIAASDGAIATATGSTTGAGAGAVAGAGAGAVACATIVYTILQAGRTYSTTTSNNGTFYSSLFFFLCRLKGSVARRPFWPNHCHQLAALMRCGKRGYNKRIWVR